MKNKTILISLALILSGAFVSAQTVDEIIAKHVQSSGGKEQLSKLTSVYIEGTVDVMGTEGPIRITTLNGKGYKQEVEVMGSVITTCYNDKEGWSVNPLTGSTSAEVMPDIQYRAGKDQIYIGAPFIFYPQNGYKAELLGNETVGGANAHKVKVTSPDNQSVVYYFDAGTGYILRTVQQADMMGQVMENIMNFSDYRLVDGYLQAHKMVMDMGGQFEMTMNITKVEVNKPVEEAFFARP